MLIGALLPDLIDKPLFLIIYNKPLESGKVAAHSLLFIMLMLIPALISFIKFNRTGILVLTACSFIHELLDKMWEYPKLWYWPFHHWAAVVSSKAVEAIATGSSGVIGNAYKSVAHFNLLELYTRPYFLISDLIGAAVLSYFFLSLIRNKQVGTFLLTGKVRKRQQKLISKTHSV